MSKVYVVNGAGHDIVMAERYGEIVYLTKGTINIFATDRLIKELRDKLQDAKVEDYMLLSGYALLNMIVFSLLLERLGEVRVLIYDFKEKKYIRRDITKEVMKGEEGRSSECQIEEAGATEKEKVGSGERTQRHKH